MKNNILKLMIILLIPLIFVGCRKEAETVSADLISIYLGDQANGQLVVKKVESSLGDNATKEKQAIEVLELLVEEQASGGIPEELEPTLVLKDAIAYITFSQHYEEISVIEQVMVKASVIYSITEIEGIDQVEFFVEDTPLVNTRGQRIGPMGRSSVVVNGLNPNPSTNIQRITLYFTKEGTGKLYPEVRAIPVSNNIPLEYYIIEELIKGPESDELMSTLPADTKVNDLKIQENVVQVDLSYSLQAKEVATPLGETLLAYSIVNSLTELPYITKVTFLRDGKSQGEGESNIDLNRSLERDESLFEYD